MNKRVELQNNLKKLRSYRTDFKKAIEIKQKSVKRVSQSINKLENILNKCDYIINVYENASGSAILKMGKTEFENWMIPIASFTATASIGSVIYSQSDVRFGEISKELLVIQSTDGTADNSIKSIKLLSASNPASLPNVNNIEYQYRIKDELDKNIEFLKIELRKITPDIEEDFESFVNKFYAFKTDVTKYQDLIGARSMFFNKFIFDYVEQTYGRQPNRKKDIEKFVFGSAMPVAIADAEITKSKDLYSKLSAQTGRSAKLGNLTLAEIEVQFRDIINTMASIIKLRNSYYQP